MADPKENPEKSEDKAAEIEDAVTVDETDVKQGEEVSEAGTEAEEASGESEGDTAETGEDAEGAEPEAEADAEAEDLQSEKAPEEEAELPAEDTEEPVEVSVEDTPTASASEPVVIRKGGFFPALLGGVIAAGIGAGGALYLFPEGLSGGAGIAELQTQTQSSLAAQDKKIGELSGRIDGIKMPADPSADLARLSGEVAKTNERLDQIAAQIAGYDTRLSEMEKKPITEFASKEAVDAYERELKALQDSMAKQRSEIEDMLAAAEAKKADAAASARDVVLRGALAKIQVAMDTGASFAEPVSELKQAGIKVPDVLDRMADGVPTQAALLEAFPEAARAALRASRDTETGGGALRFLRDQLGVRSLQPREGDDADAILSRAEAALKAGHLSDAMAELQTLPEQGRVELTDWMALATQRADAMAAAEALSQQLMNN